MILSRFHPSKQRGDRPSLDLRHLEKYGKIFVNKSHNPDVKRVIFRGFYSFFMITEQFQRIGAENL